MQQQISLNSSDVYQTKWFDKQGKKSMLFHYLYAYVCEDSFRRDVIFYVMEV